MPPANSRRLGRGLEALISAARPPATSQPEAIADREARGELQRIPIAAIRENPFQPRKHFDERELAELEASLRENGLLQPVTVRHAGGSGGGYELVAGERRLRAASRLGWKDIPALVRDLDDQMLLTLALVENLQRADLNPLEQAEGYRKLIDEFGLTQQRVAAVVGKERSTIANMLRLLELPPTVRRLVQESHLSMGHARALLALDGPNQITELAREIVAKGLSVREVENRVRERVTRGKKKRPAGVAQSKKPAEVRHIEERLRRRLQTDVRVELTADDRGVIRIPFYSADDFERVLEFILPAPEEHS